MGSDATPRKNPAVSPETNNCLQPEGSKPDWSASLSDRGFNDLWRGMTNQDCLRDSIAQKQLIESAGRHGAIEPLRLPNVDLVCSDNGACAPGGIWHLSSTPTQKLLEAANGVEKALGTANFQHNPDSPLKEPSAIEKYADYIFPVGLMGVLGQRTFNAPFKEGSTSVWETASRPYEAKLINELTSTSGPISLQALTEAAVKVSGNDGQMALLTLANFTKNMAAIERRQVSPPEIDPSVRQSYDKHVIDGLFHRIQGLADTPTEKYNKEGAIYHFFGALLASSQLGQGVTQHAVSVNNFYNKLPGVSDRIEEAAGTLGARIRLPLSSPADKR
jgi:hypothetical protein